MGTSPTTPPERWKPNDDGSWWPKPPPKRPRPTGPAMRSKQARKDRAERIKRQIEAMAKEPSDAT
jgi:hypothetical protein